MTDVLGKKVTVHKEIELLPKIALSREKNVDVGMRLLSSASILLIFDVHENGYVQYIYNKDGVIVIFFAHNIKSDTKILKDKILHLAQKNNSALLNNKKWKHSGSKRVKWEPVSR